MLTLQEKAERRLEREGRRTGAERQRLGLDAVSTSSSSSTGSSSPPASLSHGSGAFTKSSTVSSRGHGQPMNYSEHFQNTAKLGRFTLGGVTRKVHQAKRKGHANGVGQFRVVEQEADGRKSVKSLSGLQRDNHVMYVERRGMRGLFPDPEADTRSVPYSEPDLHTDEHTDGKDTVSIFDRPGFGSVAFFNRRPTSNALIALSKEKGGREGDPSQAFQRTSSFSDSIGTLGSLAARIQDTARFDADLPWGDEDVALEDDQQGSPLELFLVANGLEDWLSLLAREHVDLPALLLLTDADLKELGLPLGPRRKVLEAVARRKRLAENPPPITETLL